MSTLLELVEQQAHVEARRLQRAREYGAGELSILPGPGQVEGVVKGSHTARIQTHPTWAISCTCPDWKNRGQGRNQPCKHLLALALHAEVPQDPPAASPVALASVAPASAPTPFGTQVATAVARAADALAASVGEALAAGGTPFLIGPTGCAKTSAVRSLAVARGWGFEEIGGSDSFADADLVGVRLPGQALPGLLARAFARARAGETVLVLLDEFLRFNGRVQDLLMRPLLPTPPEVARAMGLATDEPLRLVEAPLWGVEHAPASRIHLVLAANPWGAALDPALVRRVEPVFVGFDEQVAALFGQEMKLAIEMSWAACARGELALPIEYGALVRATGPDDRAILRRYLHRLRALDAASAEGFQTLLAGQSVQVAA